MKDLIQLREYDDQLVVLNAEDWDFLIAELGKRFTLRRNADTASKVINPNQYVGLLLLPSGTTLQVLPKVPLTNLFYMLSKVWNFEWPFRDETIHLDSFDEMLELIADLFAELLENRIDAGLYRFYVEQDENLPFLRGRINFAEDLRQNLLARHRLCCRYAEFTWDIEENQILRQVAHLLRTPPRVYC